MSTYKPVEIIFKDLGNVRSVRAVKALNRKGINTVDDLSKFDLKTLKYIRGIGITVYNHIIENYKNSNI